MYSFMYVCIVLLSFVGYFCSIVGIYLFRELCIYVFL